MITAVSGSLQSKPVAPPAIKYGLALVVLCSVGMASVLPGRYGLLLLLVAGLCSVCAAFALKQFRLFVMVLLVIRPLLDILKVDGAPGFVQPTSLLSLLFLAVAPVWLVSQRRHSGGAPLTALSAATIGFLLSAALSTAGSLDPMHSAVELLKTASWVCMFLVIRRLCASEREIRGLLLAISLGAVLPLLLGTYELVTPGAGVFMEHKDGILRLRSTFDQSNNFARYLMLAVLLAVGLSSVLPRARRHVLTCGTLLALVLLGATYTRSAWVGFAVGALVMLSLQHRKKLLVLVSCIFCVAVAAPGAATALSDAARPTPTTEWSNNSVAWRLAYWEEVSSLGLEQPVTGIGPGVTVLRTSEAKEPHNEYLRAWVEGGAVGAASYLALLATGLAAAVKVTRRRGRPVISAVGAAAVGVMVAVAVSSAASNVVDSLSFMWYFGTLAAVVDRGTWSQRAASLNSFDPVRA